MTNSAEAKTISTISEFFFEIPPYQRLYEWEKEQIETLLEDAKKACFDTHGNQQDNIYFIGNVVVSQQENKYILIDGQQRLTTLFLVGVYLATRSEIKDNPWKGFVKNDKQIRISMPLREEEEKWLLDFIKKTKGKGFGENLIAPSSIHEKILGGLKTIQTWFEQNFKDSQEKEGYFSTFLYNNVCFALVELAEDTDLNQFFVRMNNRGKQLEKHEILKARLLDILQKDGSNDEWKTYAKIWDLCSDMDKYIFQSASDRKFLNKEIDKQRGMKLYEILEKIEEVSNGNNEDNSKDDDDLEKVKSIIDFPTFLLHVAKLERTENIPINKDKLLESIVTLEQKEQKVLYLNDKGKVENFIFAMLKYRILFDYFVIKRMVDEDLSKSGEYSIRHLSSSKKNNNTYYSIGGSVMEDLAMLQNYLRVARAGDKQNYHHWLTPFLKKIAEIDEIRMALNAICLPIQEVCKNCKSLDDIKVDPINEIGKEQHAETEKKLVQFLEELDRDLAYGQIGSELISEGTNGDKLISVVNQYLGENEVKWRDKPLPCFYQWALVNLNQGVGTPHYWFYRLEYYLWKWRSELKEKIQWREEEFKDFVEIANKYRFRGLNSIEHIQSQSKKKEWDEWEKNSNVVQNKICGINDFGNLALISQSFNSSLNNQSMEKKWVDIKNKEDVESLKMCLAYASVGGEYQKWNPTTAKEHQDTMLDILKASLKNKEQK